MAYVDAIKMENDKLNADNEKLRAALRELVNYCATLAAPPESARKAAKLLKEVER